MLGFVMFTFCYFNHRIINVYVWHCNIHFLELKHCYKGRKTLLLHITNEKNWSQRDQMTWQETLTKKNVIRFVDLMQCHDSSIASVQKSLNKEQQDKIEYSVFLSLKYREKRQQTDTVEISRCLDIGLLFFFS